MSDYAKIGLWIDTIYSRIRIDNEVTEPFVTQKGFNQGAGVATYLFNETL